MGYLDGLDDDLSPSASPAAPPRPPTNGTGNGHGRLPPNAQSVGSYLDLLNGSLDADLDEEVAPTLPWEDPANPLVQLASRGQALPTPTNQPPVTTPAPVVAAAGEALRTGALGAARALGEGVVAIPRNIGTTIRALGEQATARAGMPTELAPNVEIPGDPLTAAVREGLGTALTGVGGALESTFTPTPPAQLPPMLQRDEAMAREALETLQAHPASRFATDMLRQAPQLASTVALAATPGGQPLALGALGAQSGGAAYAEAEQAGATPEQAMGAMVGHGVAEGLAERLPLGNLMRLIGEGGTMKPVRRALGEVLKQAGMEFTQEALTSVAQRAVDLATYKGARGEAFTDEDLIAAAYEGGLGAAMGGVSAAMAVRGAGEGEPPAAVPVPPVPATQPPVTRRQPAVAPTAPSPRSVFAQPVRGGEVVESPPVEESQPPSVAEAGEGAAGRPVPVPEGDVPPPAATIAPVEPRAELAPASLPGWAELPRVQVVQGGMSPVSAAPAERRVDLATRRRVADMTPDDMARTLLTDELTGLGNRRAYEEAGYDQHNAQASVDLDSLKWINDNLGHDQGDEVLRKVGQAFRDTNVPGFRFGGDEFRVAAETDEDLDTHLQRVSDHLRAAGPLTYRAPDGTTYSVPVELTYGTATGSDAFTEADRQLIAAKSAREARGERAGRGERPPGVVVEPAAGGQVGVAGREQVEATKAVEAPKSSVPVKPAGILTAEETERLRLRDEVERTRPRIDYAALNKMVYRQRAALTRAINSGDPRKVIEAARAAVYEWNQPGAMWPDDWSRWQRAVDDATEKSRSPRVDLRDLSEPSEASLSKTKPATRLRWSHGSYDIKGEKDKKPWSDTVSGITYGAFGVHSTTMPGGGKSYVLTHKASGLALGRPGKLADVRARAERLQAGASELVEWDGSGETRPTNEVLARAWTVATGEQVSASDVHETPQREEVTPSAQQEGGAEAQAAETQVPPPSVAIDTRAAVEPTQPPAAVEPVPVTATAPNEQSSAPAAAVRETPAVVQRTPTSAPTAPAEAPTTRPDRRSEVTHDDDLTRASNSLRSLMEQGGLARTISADELMKTVAREFDAGGSLAAGTFTAKDAYDALELAVNTRIASRGKASAAAGTSLIDAKTRILALEEASARLPTQTRRTSESEAFQQFSTPPSYAYLANWAAALTPDDVYLEPSAGTGGLLSIAKASGVKTIYANELAPRRAHMLSHPDLGVEKVFRENAEQLDNALPADVQPTVVVMNPPFSQTAGRMGDKTVAMTGATHVEQALRRLAPGGRLVAIVGGGRSNDPKAQGGMRMAAPAYKGWWSRIKSQYNVKANVGIPGAVYRKHGTVFETRLLVIDKTGPTIGVVETADATSLIHALAILETVRDERQPAAATTPTVEPSVADRASSTRPAQEREGQGRLERGQLSAPARPVGTRQRRATPAVSESPPAAEPARGDVAVAPDERAADAAAERRGRGAVRAVSGEPESRGRGERAAGEPGGRAEQAGDRGDVERAVVESAPRDRRSASELTDSIFEPYAPQRLRVPGARPHPGALVEAAAMSTIDPPEPTYTPSFSRKFIESGVLSLPQLEVTVYAGQAHSQMLPAVGNETPRRRGLMLGDGTGVGKGREIASVILDNWNQGRKKAVWVSEKWSLHDAAVRDWTALGGQKLDVVSVKKVKGDESLKAAHGIAFTTYDTLKQGGTEKAQRKAAEAGTVSKSRVDQLIDWLGADFDGVLVFDEAHNMGNAVDSKGTRGTRKASEKAKAGAEFQRRLPNARVLYVSATAATEVGNLAYADRLGLWGPGTAFADRENFVDSVESGGVAVMEVVARDMKALGSYVARSLSFSDGTDQGTVRYARLEHPLTTEQVEVYNTLADAWQVVLNNVDEALKVTASKMDDRGRLKVDGRAKGAALSAFWGANQRFFSQVLTTMQMPSVIKEMEADRAAGRSVVAQLVNTMEASQDRQLAKLSEEDSLEDFDLTPRDQLMQYIEGSFPVTQLEEFEDEEGNTGMRPARRADGSLVENRQAVALREKLLDDLAMIRVPESPLDMLINHFGRDEVAEVTGRKQRVVRGDDGKLVREVRGSRSNAADVSAFAAGRKHVLIFSAAGGTGVDYHASNEIDNRERRAHYLLQPGWRADQAIQGLGRTHRTNQASAPIYRLTSTDLPGHRRFVSTVARRLDQLGALTSGERQAGRRGIFAEKDNLEGQSAREALLTFYRDIYKGNIEGLTEGQFAAQTGLKLSDGEGNLRKDLPPITQFLNRLLAMRTDAQERVFRAFEERWDAVTEAAIARGELDVGTETIRAEKIEKVEDRVVYTHGATGAQTRYVKLKVYRRTSPVSWEAVQGGARLGKAPEGYLRGRESGKVYAIMEGQPRTKADGRVVRQYRMVDAAGNLRYHDIDELYAYARINKTDKSGVAEVEKEWNDQVAAVPSLYARDEHMLVGVLLPVWDRIRTEKKKVYRLQTADGERLLGRSLDPKDVSSTLKALGAGTATLTPQQAVDRLTAGEVRVELVNGWTLSRKRAASEWRIELRGGYNASDLFQFRRQLEAAGVFFERHEYQMRAYVPVGSEKGARAYEELVKLHPVSEVVELGGGSDDGGGGGGSSEQGIHGNGDVDTSSPGYDGGEAGFISVKPLADLMHWARRHFTSMGLRPASLDDAMVRMKAAIAARANRIDAIARDVESLKKKYKGSLTRKQLDTYLDDALRGMNLRTGAEALDERQVARIAAARGVAPEALRERLAERVPLAWAGLRHAPEFAPLLREMRDLMDAMARDLRRAGLLDDANARELERHYGLYVHRQYEAVRNPKFAEHMKASPLWGRAVELTQAKFPDKPQSEIEGWLLTYVDRAKALPNGRVLLPGGTPEGAQDLSPLRQRTDLEDLKRLLLGEVRGATSNFVTTASLMARLVEEQKFLDEVASVGLREGWLTKKPSSESGVDTLVQIDPTWRGSTEKGKAGTPEIGEPPGLDHLTTHRSKDRTSPVGGLFTTKDVYDELMGTYDHDAVPRWLEWYMRANWFVKWGATAGSIQGANRNFISNFLYVLANGVNPLSPSRFTEAGTLAYPRVFGDTQRERLERVEKFIRLGLFDQGTDVGDLKRMETEAQGDRTKADRVADVERGVSRALRLSSEFYQAPDNFAKAYAFGELYPVYRKALPSTMSDEQVERHVAGILRRTMQNYGAVPRGIRTLSARVPVVAPFLSFGEEVVRNVKNIGLVSVEEMRSGNPGLQRIAARRVAGTLAALSLPAFTTFVIRWLLNTDPEDDDRARRFVPPWSRNADLTVLPSLPGTLSYVDWGFMDTFAMLKQPFYALARGDVEGAAYALNRSFGEEILFGALMDVRANEKPTGGEIYNPQDTWGARQLSKLKYIGRVAEPGTARSAQRIYESTQPGAAKVLWQELLALGGPRITTIDLKLAVEIHGRKFMEDTRDARQLELRPKVGSQERGGEKAAASLQEVAESMATDLVAARGLGVSEDELRSAMSAAQVPQWAQDALLNGEIQDVVDHYRELNRERMEEEADEAAATGGG